MNFRKILMLALVYGLMSLFSLKLYCQSDDQLIIVPSVVSDPAIPYVVYEHAPITLKAILRNTTSTDGYNVSWDLDNDGNYSEGETFFVAEDAAVNGVRDIGTAFLTPYVQYNKYYTITVKVVNLTTSEEIYGAFPLLILNWEPDPNPLNWTDDQIRIIREVAIQEDLWYLHRQLTNLSGAGVSNMTGSYGHSNTNSHVLDLFVSNGHFPAYPPGTVNNYGYTLPDGWEAKNDNRWNTDPYAETALRIMNFQLSTYSTVTIPAAEEDSACGYNPSGEETYSNRLPETTNNKGLRSVLSTSDAGVADGSAQALSGLAKSLYVFNGVPVQTGATGVIGKKLEYIVQEIIDNLVYHQIDSGSAVGGFYYSAKNGSYDISLGETGSGVARGLWEAEKLHDLYGLVVNNRIKYRMAENVFEQQGPDSLVRRFSHTTGGNNNFNYTGAYLGICHWLGIDTLQANDDTLAFPGYCTYTRGELRSTFDGYLATATPLWTSDTKLDRSSYLDHFWENGDYLSGDTSGVYDQSLGSTFNMFEWAMGLRESYPSLDSIGDHDWKKEFSIHLLRGQDRMDQNGSINYSVIGRFADDYCTYTSHSCGIDPPRWSSVLAGRTLTAIQGLGLPKAVASGMPGQVAVGDSVTFSQSGSLYLTNVDFNAIYWDVDQSNGLWWDNGGDTDFAADDMAQDFHYAYTMEGTYTATLYIEDIYGNSDSSSVTVSVVPAMSAPGNCIEFNGQSGKVRVANSADTEPSGPFTLEAWVYVDSTVTGAAIIDNGFATGDTVNNCGGFDLSLLSDTSRRFVFRVCNGTVYPEDAISVISENEYDEDVWTHVAAVFSGSELVLYVNGIEEGRTAFTGPVDYTYLNNDAYGLNIGCYIDDDEDHVFKGMIDEVRIWGDERTAAEIRSDICRVVAGDESGLNCYYRFDYISGAVTVDDLSPKSNYAFLDGMDSSMVWIDSEAFTTWDGSSGTIWQNNNNWTDGIPEPGDNAGIAPSPNYPAIIINDTCRILAISSGASLTLSDDSLTVTKYILNAGQLTVMDTLVQNHPSSILINDGQLINNGVIILRQLINGSDGEVIIHEGKELKIED